MKQLTEAAALYEAAGYYDKAAQLNIKLKNWANLAASRRNLPDWRGANWNALALGYQFLTIACALDGIGVLPKHKICEVCQC